MPTITQFSDYAQTSLAAYATGLAQGLGNNADLYRQDLVGMSASQANAFDATWAVLQQSAPSTDGFSAVLLQNRTTDEKVLAIAGTDPGSARDLIADRELGVGGEAEPVGIGARGGLMREGLC